MKLDHFVVNISRKYQEDEHMIKEIRKNGFPYEPKWGKGTKGFKASNLWIGNEYLEMIHLLREDGGGWKREWVKLFNNGHRGLVCLMLDVKDINTFYNKMKERNVNLTLPATLEFKWFFNILTRKMPWKNAYFNFFEEIPFQIGLQQMDSKEAYEFMEQYMVPNSKENNIVGIETVQIEGKYTDTDFQMIEKIFEVESVTEEQITVTLQANQKLVFKKGIKFTVTMEARSNNPEYIGKEIQIENCKIINI